MKRTFNTPTTFFQSTKHALRGIWTILKNERNFRIQILAAISVSLVGIILNISHQDWIAVGFLIALVLISEAFNSVIEAVCDTVSKEYRVNIKYAKDVSAGAVFVSAFVSVVIGIIIFIPYIIDIF